MRGAAAMFFFEDSISLKLDSKCAVLQAAFLLRVTS
jgi:hypothetical protein